MDPQPIHVPRRPCIRQASYPEGALGLRVEVAEDGAMIELTLPGRPVPWARARKSKWGGFFTPLRQAAHRETLATLIALKMREKGVEQFEGPVGLIAAFDYGKNETRLMIFELDRCEFKSTRCDLDNLIKEISEACQDSGLVKDDAQIAVIVAEKLK